LIDYSDRGIFLKHGELILDGPCREVVKAYADDLVEDEGGVTSASEFEPPQFTVETPALSGMDTSAEKTVGRDLPPIEIDSVRLLDEKGRAFSAVGFGNVVQVAVTVCLRQAVPEPCFGIQLSSPDGIILWSTTTQSMSFALPAMSAGCYQFRWNLTVNFSGNRYIVAIGVGQILNGEYKRHHRLDYAGHFDVLPVPHSGGGWLAPLPSFQIPTQCTELLTKETGT
jgi:lipopolysaccharide transport system ATP-binding protein